MRSAARSAVTASAWTLCWGLLLEHALWLFLFFRCFLPARGVCARAHGFAAEAGLLWSLWRFLLCGVDVLCAYMCGVCRLYADILCPLRLLWFLSPVHWGRALPIPGGHLAVLCWHGVILWLRARSVDPNRSPGGNVFRPQCSGLCGHDLLVSDTYSLINWLKLSRFFVPVTCFSWFSLCVSVSSTSSTWSTAWPLFSSSMESFCWPRVSTPRAPSSSPSESSGAPSAADASA